METFRGRAHLPGADKEWGMELELDWNKKEVSVRIPEAPGGVTTWPGLLVQTFDSYEIAFRTKGIPPLLTHWWHLVRMEDNGDFWGMVLGLPNVGGEWRTCVVALRRIV